MNDPDLAAVISEPQRFFDHSDAKVRRLAISTVAAATGDVDALAHLLGTDPDPRVRAEAAEALGRRGDAAVPALMAALSDGDAVVIEAVATALGETGSEQAVPWLIEAAEGHGDRLVREAAVAALGAIGDGRAVATLLSLVASAPPQVRRRSVVALTVFDGPEVEAAIRAARDDRNPMVREAAEMVVGRQLDDGRR